MQESETDAGMKILQAIPEQSCEIVRLNDTVQKIHAEQHPDVFKYPSEPSEMETFFSDKIAKENNFIFLAAAAGHAVGYVWCSIEVNHDNVFTYEQKRVCIHQLSVESKSQRKGVGRELMNAVINLAQKKGIDRLVLDSWVFNTEAHAFFERFGFSQFNIKMWRKIKID